MPRKKFVIPTIAFILSALVFPIILLLWPSTVGTLDIVALSRMEDGSKLALTQSYNGVLTEPYSIALWLRKDNRWGWFYISHEGLRCITAKLVLDKADGRFAIRKNGLNIGSFDVEHGRLQNAGETFPRDPIWMPDGWELTQGARYRTVLNKATSDHYKLQPQSRE